MSNASKTIFHVGVCKDILKAIEFYDKLPRLSVDKVNYLVYLEIYTLENEAKERFEELNKMSFDAKKEVVSLVNPEFVELIIGVNIDI